jgi:uncharacterized RmlC-like cupin family protein
MTVVTESILEPSDMCFNSLAVPLWVPHQDINASEDEELECVLVRNDREAVAVNLPDVEPIEKPESVRWGGSDACESGRA